MAVLQVNAGVITESFSSVTQKESSTAVWNLGTGFIHPTLQIKDWDVDGVLPFSTSAIDVGDGSNGIFNSSTYANFGNLVGFTLFIDANIFPVLKFTSFHLENGYTLTSVNGPLVIYSQTTVTIDGTILCSGVNGSNASGALGGAGGAGRCGGNTGGAGGSSQNSGTPGLPATGLVSGGGGGTYVGVALGAGGGGAGAYAGNPGAPGDNSAAPATNLGGTAGNGAAGANHEFTILSGSPSGGGGSGSDTEGGGGGGGGGGTIVIHAAGDVIISATGAILAVGGNGGGANSGGGGGGGGGGSVNIFTPVNLTLAAGTDVDVTGGLGSIPAVPNAGNGGTGSFGRTWDISATFSGAGSESHGSVMAALGSIEYVTVPQTIISKSYDTQSSLAVFNSVTANPASPDVVFQVSGSSDNFTADDTGWFNVSQLASLEKKRYVKFKMILTNSNAITPTQVNDVSINFDSGIKENFEFKSGCGITAINPPAQGRFPAGIILFLLFLPVALALILKQAERSKLVKAKKKY